MSKRKIIQYVNDALVTDFDDPRLLTICGLRKRGFTNSILKKIISHCSFERHDSNLEVSLIDHYLREELDKISCRMFAVIDPMRVNIVDEDQIVDCNHPTHPKNPTFGFHITKLSSDIFIESPDFRESSDNKYYRLGIDTFILQVSNRTCINNNRITMV